MRELDNQNPRIHSGSINCCGPVGSQGGNDYLEARYQAEAWRAQAEKFEVQP